MIKLTKRLQTCADYVRHGSRLADIGCDHGYVPVYLTEQGVIRSAVAADINEGPLASCRSLVVMHGLEAQIRCVLSDGLDKIEQDEADDILIAGMGGELIASILGRCPYAKDKHLILNPMTHPELARQWLYENGFSILHDVIVADAGHYYSVMDASYTGEFTETDDIACFLGKIDDFSEKEYFRRLTVYLKNKEKGGADYTRLLQKIEELLNDNG